MYMLQGLGNYIFFFWFSSSYSRTVICLLLILGFLGDFIRFLICFSVRGTVRGLYQESIQEIVQEIWQENRGFLLYAFLPVFKASFANPGIRDIWVTLCPKDPALQGDGAQRRRPLADDSFTKINNTKNIIIFSVLYKFNQPILQQLFLGYLLICIIDSEKYYILIYFLFSPK